MTQPRLWDDNPSTFDANGEGAVAGEPVAERGVAGRVGVVRESAAGDRWTELLVGDVNVASAVTTPGAFGQRITATVTNRNGEGIVGAIVDVAVLIDASDIVAVAIGPVGTLRARVVDAIDQRSAFVRLITGAGGEAAVDVTTTAGATGTASTAAVYPGPGFDSDALTFAP